MKRDMDLIRDILLKIEADDDHPAFHQQRPDDQIVHHFLLLREAELIDGVVVQVLDQGGLVLQIVDRPRLTWAGHEFLDAARNDTVWTSAKARVGNMLDSVSFGVLTQVLIETVKQQIGLKP